MCRALGIDEGHFHRVVLGHDNACAKPCTGWACTICAETKVALAPPRLILEHQLERAMALPCHRHPSASGGCLMGYLNGDLDAETSAWFEAWLLTQGPDRAAGPP